jgi:hypothetical protein
MRSVVVVALSVAGLMSAAENALAQRGRSFADQMAAQNGWEFSLSAGKRLARATGKPLMVVLRCVP